MFIAPGRSMSKWKMCSKIVNKAKQPIREHYPFSVFKTYTTSFIESLRRSHSILYSCYRPIQVITVIFKSSETNYPSFIINKESSFWSSTFWIGAIEKSWKHISSLENMVTNHSRTLGTFKKAINWIVNASSCRGSAI